MRRRTLLQLLGLTTTAIAGVELGDETDATLQLYCGRKPVTEPLPVRFRYNSTLTVELKPSQAFQCDSAVLRAPQVGERWKTFITPPIWVMPEDTLKLSWLTAPEFAYRTGAVRS